MLYSDTIGICVLEYYKFNHLFCKKKLFAAFFGENRVIIRAKTENSHPLAKHTVRQEQQQTKKEPASTDSFIISKIYLRLPLRCLRWLCLRDFKILRRTPKNNSAPNETTIIIRFHNGTSSPFTRAHISSILLVR